jgi:starvation-inducible DNA-binding protein
MSQLGDALRVVLADTFALYLKTHNFHWNVEGQDFYEYHKFFQKLYEELWEAVDGVAEEIRSLGEYAPGSFNRFSELTNIQDSVTIPSGVEMVHILLEDNEKVIASLHNAYIIAENAQAIGISNFLQDRIDIHMKHGWQLRSTVKNR